MDDATRVAYAEVLPDEKAVTATAFLERAVQWFRDRDVWVQRVMTDNGSCYRSKRFGRVLERLEIRHIFTRPYRPQTNEKAERFIQTAKREHHILGIRAQHPRALISVHGPLAR